MRILNTKIGKILTTDWIDVLVDRVTLNMYEKEQQKLKKQKQQLLEHKKKNGLTDEERLSPIDSNCDHDFIKSVEILEREPFYDNGKRNGEIIHQKVTYIDDSIKNFDIHMTLTAIPIPEDYKKCENKVKQKTLSN